MHNSTMNHQNSATLFNPDDLLQCVTTRSLTYREIVELLVWLDELRDPCDDQSYRSRSFTYNNITQQLTVFVRSESDRVELILRAC